MHKRPSPRAALALAALALFTAWITWRAKAIEIGSRWRNEPSALTGKPAPDFTLQSLAGARAALADYRGKTAVVAFWASWCGPCRMELPMLARFYRQNHKPDSAFEFLAISIDDSPEPAQSAAAALKIPFPVLLDADSSVAGAYGVESIPMLFVIDKTGKVAYSHVGFDVGIDFLLAQQLGIRNYAPIAGGNQ
jgi:peroxiredoxin